MITKKKITQNINLYHSLIVMSTREMHYFAESVPQTLRVVVAEVTSKACKAGLISMQISNLTR